MAHLQLLKSYNVLEKQGGKLCNITDFIPLKTNSIGFTQLQVLKILICSPLYSCKGWQEHQDHEANRQQFSLLQLQAFLSFLIASMTQITSSSTLM